MTKNKDIFRKAALDNISSPEQTDLTDQMEGSVTVIKASTILALVSVAIMMLIAILWCIFGSVPEVVNGKGVIINIDKIESIKFPGTGIVENTFIARGDRVYNGQVITRIERQDVQPPVSTQVISNSSGLVMEVPVRKGDYIQPGTTIAVIDTADVDMPIEALVYFSGADGKKLTPGMTIGLVPGTVKQEEYGYIVGIIMEVSEFPVSDNYLNSSLQNTALVNTFKQIMNPIEVKVSIVPDPNSYSGYKWSSSHGPKQKIGSGFICDASVITEVRRPISILIPWIRKRFLGIGEATAEQ